jgi:small-conductance mechanosensitive channel
LLFGLLSIWFDDPNRLATAIGLVTAGLAFALQRVITATAGYFVILRGKTFNVGDRIVMGGVRGDVIALSFMQTTIMEMGQPPLVQSDGPAIWVHSRQYTGRIVTVSNAKVFDEPVYNYSRDFPYIWEEMSLPVRYQDDRAKAEQILLKAARKHSMDIAMLAEADLADLRKRYCVNTADVAPRVFWRLTDNWLELTVRFLTRDHGIRELTDAMSRDILADLDASGIGIASENYEVVGFPPLRVELVNTHNFTSGPADDSAKRTPRL